MVSAERLAAWLYQWEKQWESEPPAARPGLYRYLADRVLECELSR